MTRLHTTLGMLLCLGAASCATAPKSSAGRDSLESDAFATLEEMKAKDPGLADMLRDASGYVVFPQIGKGGFVVGAATGRGVLYQHGRPTGFTRIDQGSIGAQIGAETMSELIVFNDPFEIERLKAGTFQVGSEVTAVVLTTGAAAAGHFNHDVAVFVVPRGGLMAGIAVSGQKLSFDAGG